MSHDGCEENEEDWNLLFERFEQ